MLVILFAVFYLIFSFLENVSVCFLDSFLPVSRRWFNTTGWLIVWDWGGSNTLGWLFGWFVGLEWGGGWIFCQGVDKIVYQISQYIVH